MKERKSNASPGSNEEEQKFSRLAQKAFQKQDWDAAEMFCTKAIKSAPGNARHYMFRGWIRAGRSRSIQDRRYYLEVLQAILSDYQKACDLAPSDPQVMMSLIEAEICGGDATSAGKHASQLWRNTNTQPWKGLCAWLGAVAYALTDGSEESGSDFLSHLDIAAASILMDSWNTAEIEKYLNEYARDDFPPERVKKALKVHNAVTAAARESQEKGDKGTSEVVALVKMLNDAAGALANEDGSISIEKKRELENALVDVKRAATDGTGTSSDQLAAVTEMYQQIFLAQGIKLANKAAQNAKKGEKQVPRKLYSDSLYWLKAAALVDLDEPRTKQNVPAGFMNYAGFLAMELKDCDQAKKVLATGLKLYPDNEMIREQSKQVERMRELLNPIPIKTGGVGMISPPKQVERMQELLKPIPHTAQFERPLIKTGGAGMIYPPKLELFAEADLGYKNRGMAYGSIGDTSGDGMKGVLAVGCLVSGGIGIVALIAGLSLSITALSVVGIAGFVALALCIWGLTQIE